MSYTGSTVTRKHGEVFDPFPAGVQVLVVDGDLTCLTIVEKMLSNCGYKVMSADDSHKTVMKGVTHGACDYLMKPVRIEALKNIWQHVVRKNKNESKDFEQSVSWDGMQDDAISSHANEGNWKNSKRKADNQDEETE